MKRLTIVAREQNELLTSCLVFDAGRYRKFLDSLWELAANVRLRRSGDNYWQIRCVAFQVLNELIKVNPGQADLVRKVFFDFEQGLINLYPDRVVLKYLSKEEFSEYKELGDREDGIQ